MVCRLLDQPGNPYIEIENDQAASNTYHRIPGKV